MIIPKRRVVLYLVLLSTSLWIYLATYSLFSAGADPEVRENGEQFVLAMYDKTPDRNPDKPGEWGAAVSLNFIEKRGEAEGFKEHAFNRVASDKVSLQRNLVDVRNSKYVLCFGW